MDSRFRGNDGASPPRLASSRQWLSAGRYALTGGRGAGVPVSDTQWRTAGLGGVLGLDYAAVRPVTEALGIAWSADLLDRLRLLEAVAAQALRRKAE